MLLLNTKWQYKESSKRVVEDNIITAELITLVNNKNRLSFDVNVIDIDGQETPYFQPRLRLKWLNPEYHYEGDLGIGQVWRFKVHLIDSEASGLLAGHIRYTGFIDKGEIINSKFSLRGELYQVFKSVLPANSNPMLYALSFGDRSYIGNELWTQFKLLGIGHLVAISGLHIGLIFGFCYACILRLLRLFNQPYQLFITLAFSLCVSLFYAWIAGFSLPALRAIILLSVHCLYRLQYYKITLVQLFSIMLFVTLIVDPLAVFSVGFWLSFSAMAAVFILVWLNQRQNSIDESSALDKQGNVIKCWYRIKLAVKAVISKLVYLCHSQVLLTLFMLPMQLSVFSGVSLISVIINLIFIPVFSVLVLPVLLIAVLLVGIVPKVSGILLIIVNDVLNSIEAIWARVTVYDGIWIEQEQLISGVYPNAPVLIFILFMMGFIFKPMRVTFHSLCLLLLPLLFIAI
ncbi:ComEC/Rec2 family competence protein [Moritella sp. F3]|uniref:ComEC/Rec2 family competence protein n=1 Tax=Moritella sp. F3 TaxID=2718882 RepID=UPI001F555B81|nr:ComEC/Rec2 family competence protein [Moritella sp. F3]